jgi:hypothetical protein
LAAWPESPGQQLVDTVDGVAVCEAVEHGCDVGFRIEAVQLRGFGDGVDDRSALPAYIATDEQEVLSRDSDAPQLPRGCPDRC